MTLDIVTEDPRWQTLDLAAISERAIAATLRQVLRTPTGAEIAILACDDARIAALNAEFRDKQAPTNVLSWPAQELGAETPGDPPHSPEPDLDGTLALGDIAIAWDTCAREAAEQGKDMADHATHLIVHAALHLLGYDHVRDADATLMEALEVEILGRMGLPDPY